MLDLLEKLKDKYADIRGEHSQSVSLELKDLQKRIIENTELEKFAMSIPVQKLVKQVLSYIEKIDSLCMDEQAKDEVKLNLLKQRKAWITVLRTLLGGKSQLEAIREQIKTYLNLED
jgi:hypothetical protein